MSLGLFGLLLLGAMQSGAAQPPAENRADLCVVEGTVTAADTGQPLRKAWVSLQKSEGREPPIGSATDASGHFILKDVPPDRYRLTAFRNGYVQQLFGQKDPASPGTILALTPGQHAKDIAFQLIRAAAISGHIYDEDGDPVQNAQVRAMKFAYIQGNRGLVPAAWAMSNDLGEYRLFGLAPGQYYVAAESTRVNFGGGGGGGPTYPTTYYPSSSDSAEATPITVRAGDDYPGVDVNFQSTRTVSVSGHVFNGVTGQPGMNTNLFLTPRGKKGVPNFSFAGQTLVQDPEGNFKLEGVAPGSYYLIGITSAEGRQLTARMPIEVGDTDVTGVNMVITSGITIRGKIIPDGKVDLTGIQLALQPRETQPISFNFPASPKKDGTFVLNNVADGSYKVTAWSLPEDAYLKSATMGNEEVLLSGVEINGGQAAGNLQIVIGADGGRVDGVVVKDGKPLNAATVVLIPADAAMSKDSRWIKQTSTDQYGAFSVRGLRPGEYKVYAWEKIEPGAYEDPSFMAPFEKQATSVEVQAGRQQNLHLTVLEAPAP